MITPMDLAERLVGCGTLSVKEWTSLRSSVSQQAAAVLAPLFIAECSPISMPGGRHPDGSKYCFIRPEVIKVWVGASVKAPRRSIILEWDDIMVAAKLQAQVKDEVMNSFRDNMAKKIFWKILQTRSTSIATVDGADITVQFNHLLTPSQEARER